jgi:hypothetical protein
VAAVLEGCSSGTPAAGGGVEAEQGFVQGFEDFVSEAIATVIKAGKRT